MSILEILCIPIFHWIADHVAQTSKEAIGKADNIKLLLSHIWRYTLIMSAGMMPFFILKNALLLFFLFFITTLILHTITDFLTSKLNKKLIQKEDKHDYYVNLGFDQMLHYLQLYSTYYFTMYVLNI